MTVSEFDRYFMAMALREAEKAAAAEAAEDEAEAAEDGEE